MAKIIAHIDLNQFFVRCEEIKDPSLEGEAVAVGGDGRRGIISTCSYKARENGVHSGMPTFQARMLCKDLIVLNADYEYYELMSKEFIDFLRKYTLKIEQASIDECYCDFTDFFKKYHITNGLSFFKSLQERLFEKTKLKCSIGIAPTKFLAKMGSDYKKPMGITVIRKKDISRIIFPLKISAYYGIGKKTAPRLEKIGIKTIGDLYNTIKTNSADINDIFHNGKEDVIQCLEGESSDIVYDASNEMNKSIGATRTLDYDTNDKIYIKNFFMRVVNIVLKRFKNSNMLCRTIQITYKDANYDCGFKSNTVSSTLSDYTNSIDLLKEEALKLFNSSYKGNQIRLIGFTVKNLIPKHDVTVQMTFDNYSRHENENKTQLLINKLNREYKRKIFFRLSDKDDYKK